MAAKGTGQLKPFPDPTGPDGQPLPLVGRDLELYRLLADAESPRPRRSLVVGGPGLGKTRLMQEVVDRFNGQSFIFNVRTDTRRRGLASVLLDIPDETELLVFDDIDSTPLLNAAEAAEVLAKQPRMSVFMTARRHESFDDSWGMVLASGHDVDVLDLAPLTAKESARLLRADGVDEMGVEALAGGGAGNPRRLLEMSAAGRDAGLIPADNASTLATILGPDGRPLEPGDDGFEDVRLSASGISDALIAELAKRPELMYELSPRKFEELVAELYERDGCEVELTQASKDGGVDIYAFQRAPFGSFLTIVDCKRNRADRPVQVGLIRQLYGTVMERNASVGVMATTSYFTKGAKSFQEDRRHRLGLQDFLSIQEMLKRARDTGQSGGDA